MSKIGRRPINLGAATVEEKGHIVIVKGPKGSFQHELPSVLRISKEGKELNLDLTGQNTRKNRMLWGLHRALIANMVKGVESGFQVEVRIVGLGFKAQPVGKNLTFSLGYSHKVDFEVPADVKVDVDKTGQILTVSSHDKFLVGNVCDAIRSLRPPEPYKGTGIMRQGETIIRKAGKTKAA